MDETFAVALDAQNRLIARADSRSDLDKILEERGHARVVDVRWVTEEQLNAILTTDTTLDAPMTETAPAAVKASRKRLKDVNPPLEPGA